MGFLVVDDLKKGYHLLFIDGGKRANEQGQAEGAIGLILQEPDCGGVVATVAEKVGPVGSPHEAEYQRSDSRPQARRRETTPLRRRLQRLCERGQSDNARMEQE